MNYQSYLKVGINCIAVNENKQAIFPWKKYQSAMITKEELDYQMSDPKAYGIAVICGQISSNLEVIDIDTKYQTYDIWELITSKIRPELFDKLPIIKTKNEGRHIYIRCEVIEGNRKLASRYPTPEELQNNPQIKAYTIIETRGEGGYVVAPPTIGYQFVQKRPIPVLTIEERDELMEIMSSLNEIIEEVVIEAHNRPSTKDYGLSPFDDYNKNGDLTNLLQKHGWKVTQNNSLRTFFLRPGSDAGHSGSYNKELGLFSVFSTNTPFTPQKGYRPSAIYAILECNGDFKRAAKQLVEEGFGEKKTSFGTKLESELYRKKSDGATSDELTSLLIKKHNKGIEEAKQIIDELDSRWGEVIGTFWTIDKQGKPVIDRYKLQVFLTEQGGFRLYFYDLNSTIYRLIRIKDGFVEEASTEQIKKFIKNYIDRLPDAFDGGVTPQDLLELIYKGASVLFSDAFFEFFERADLEFLKDDATTAYFPFRNGVVVVTASDICLKSYSDLNKVIWRSQVIDRDIVLDQDVELDRIEYFRFIQKVCNDEEERYIYALSLIGYLLHKYKDPSRPYAVILAEETENEATGGGTGKGIFVKALSYVANVVRVDGKNFKIDKSFAFQRVDLDTRILAIEDTRKNVDFEGFYGIITEGITVEKKNKDELFIPYKDAPKVMFTTNYTLPNVGNHAKRRQKIFEFAPYFGTTHTPEDEFGHKLFDDWDSDEWNRFDNLMFDSVQGYLAYGIQQVENSDKLARKQVRVQFGEEFLEFFLGYIEDAGEWISQENLYNDFLSMTGFDKKDYSIKRFSKAIEESCQILKIAYIDKREKSSGRKKVYKFESSKKNEVENF